MTLPNLAASLACCAFVSTAWAQAAPPRVPPERLATLLPAKPWGNLERKQPELKTEKMPVSSTTASVVFQDKRGGSNVFLVTFRVSDQGASNASMYAYGADYLKKDVKGDSEHSAVLPGGRRVLVTMGTKDSMGVEGFVGNRWVVYAGCSHATEAQCLEAFSRYDFAAIEAFKP